MSGLSGAVAGLIMRTTERGGLEQLGGDADGIGPQPADLVSGRDGGPRTAASPWRRPS